MVLNYLAHAYRFLENPIFALGTQVPDFLNMVDRKARARKRNALQWIDADDPFVADLTSGIVQHHKDDDLFHNSIAFLKLQEQLSQHLRRFHPDPRGMRSWFTAHISIEMLLDWSLNEEDPERLGRLYQIFSGVNAEQLRGVVETVTKRDLPNFLRMHRFFIEERFLYDYSTDEGLLYRINRILDRIGLEPFQVGETRWAGIARQWVWDARQDLLRSVREPET